MAKVVLNTVRLLSMEELYSVALAKRVIVLEPELAKLIGIQSQSNTVKFGSSLQVPQLQNPYISRDSLIGRVICCALLQKGVRSKPLPSTSFVSTLVEALNNPGLDVGFQLDNIRLGHEPQHGSDSALAVSTTENSNECSDHAAGSLLTEVAERLGISHDDCTKLGSGQTAIFAAVSVIGAMVNVGSKLSDCVVGLICEALKINTGFLTCPELQKLPNCINVVRNLIWLTEDSKVIPSSKADPQYEALLTSYILANGEVQQLSKAIVKIASEMIPEVCGNTGTPIARGLMEKAWSMSLQSHVSALCVSLTAVTKSYVSLLKLLVNTMKTISEQIIEANTSEQDIGQDNSMTDITEYASLLDKYQTKLDALEKERSKLQKLDEIAAICSEAAVACVSISISILSAQDRQKTKSNDKKKQAAASKKLTLGHGNLGFFAFTSELMQSFTDQNLKPISCLNETLGGYRVMHHVGKLNELLVPRNQLRKLKVPKGTVDILPDDMLVRSMVIGAVRNIFKQHGACEIDTPVFELRETLMGKYGEDQKLIFDLKDSGGEQLSLRYDLTVPFARFLGSNKIEKMKRYHIGKVYRRDEPQINRGRFREFVQCDLDYAGAYPPMVADAEVIFILIRVLRMLMPNSFQIKLSHRVVLDSVMMHCGVPSEMHRTICSSIDKLDKEPWSSVSEEMINEKGLPESVVNKLKEFVEISGPISEVVERLRAEDIACTAEALDEMSLLSDYLSALGATETELQFDLSLARGLDYYTGIIFEAVLTKGSVGSVGAGGRYDGLIGMLSGKPTPAVGMSVGIERIMKVLAPSNVSSDITDVFVCTMGGATDLQERLQICSLLWTSGINATFHQSPKANLRKQLDAATGKQAQIVIIVGKTELEAGIVRIKILEYEEEKKGQEIEVPRTDMVATVRRVLGERGDRYSQLEQRVITGIM